MGTLWTAGTDATPAMLNQYYGNADTTTTTVTATVQTQLTTSYSIPALEPAVNSAYRMDFGGNGQWSSTQQSLAFTLSISAVAMLNNVTIAGAAFAASAAFRFTGWAEFVWSQVGGSGQVFASMFVCLTETASAVNPGTAATNTVPVADALSVNSSNINTAVSMPVFVQCAWGGAGGPTISNRHTIFRKIA